MKLTEYLEINPAEFFDWSQAETISIKAIKAKFISAADIDKAYDAANASARKGLNYFKPEPLADRYYTVQDFEEEFSPDKNQTTLSKELFEALYESKPDENGVYQPKKDVKIQYQIVKDQSDGQDDCYDEGVRFNGVDDKETLVEPGCYVIKVGEHGFTGGIPRAVNSVFSIT
jgi:hypothetical protein